MIVKVLEHPGKQLSLSMRSSQHRRVDMEAGDLGCPS